MILLDTNVLARMTNSSHPHCVPAVGLFIVS